ncbi:unnamed protein product [Prorocentrum cordatum]|uniref:Protein S-acyltransferase n=1 Tax=Prorocentrum cordatum TaxID=2364126 RepID=A0ABN9QAF4_9DINO|nr:unnamed protein product [Polarella glacialis]
MAPPALFVAASTLAGVFWAAVLAFAAYHWRLAAALAAGEDGGHLDVRRLVQEFSAGLLLVLLACCGALFEVREARRALPRRAAAEEEGWCASCRWLLRHRTRRVLIACGYLATAGFLSDPGARDGSPAADAAGLAILCLGACVAALRLAAALWPRAAAQAELLAAPGAGAGAAAALSGRASLIARGPGGTTRPPRCCRLQRRLRASRGAGVSLVAGAAAGGLGEPVGRGAVSTRRAPAGHAREAGLQGPPKPGPHTPGMFRPMATVFWGAPMSWILEVSV